MHTFFINGRADLFGSWIHNCISAEAKCYHDGDTFAGATFEESPLQATRYRGQCELYLNELCTLAGIATPIASPPDHALPLHRDAYDDVHLETAFDDEFVRLLRSRARFARPIAEPFAVVHIRRGDISSARDDPYKGISRFVPTDYFRRHVDAIRRSGIRRIIVLSEARNSDDVVAAFADCEIQLATDHASVARDWTLMATCDVLVMSPSSFSFVPALFNPNAVIYKPFWHSPLATWRNGDAQPVTVVVSTDNIDRYKTEMLQGITAAGAYLHLVVDAHAEHKVREQLSNCNFHASIHVARHGALCERYGKRNTERFNGRWANNPAKLAALEIISCKHMAHEYVWYCEDDVFCRDWSAFFGAYDSSAADLIATVFCDDLSAKFREFFVRGWLVGHPAHTQHGVAGLYCFRMSRKLAQNILNDLTTERVASHHELFVPWSCARHHAILQELDINHARYMQHNPDPRPASGRRRENLPGDGLIFHPVKSGSVHVREHARLNPPAPHLTIIINSFNASPYFGCSLDVAQQIEQALSTLICMPKIVICYGGCGSRALHTIGTRTYVTLEKNLSDYASYVAVKELTSRGIIDEHCKCLLLHDTICVKADAFLHAILDILADSHDGPRFQFAHPLGWYNMGVGDAALLAELGALFDRVTHIPKELGYALEHGRQVTHENVTLLPLRHFSKITLAKHRVAVSDLSPPSLLEQLNALTFHSLGAIDYCGKSRVAVYLASLGIYKFTHGPTSYQVPVWADADLPTSVDNWKRQKATNAHWQGSMDWALPLV